MSKKKRCLNNTWFQSLYIEETRVVPCDMNYNQLIVLDHMVSLLVY